MQSDHNLSLRHLYAVNLPLINDLHLDFALTLKGCHVCRLGANSMSKVLCWDDHLGKTLASLLGFVLGFQFVEDQELRHCFGTFDVFANQDQDGAIGGV